MRAALLYTTTISFAVGIAGASLASISFSDILFLGVVSTALALLAFWYKNSPYRRTIFLLSVALFACLLGMVRMQSEQVYEHNPAFDPYIGEEVHIEGVVRREPDVRDQTTHLYVDTGEETILVITDRYQTFAYGDSVRVIGELKRPEPFETDLGRVFDYKGYLHARGVSYMIIYGEVETLSMKNGNVVFEALFVGKQTFMSALELVIAEPHAGLAEGLLLGEKRALGESLEVVFRRTGLIHIVVLSGYNVMLVVTFVMYIFAYLFNTRIRTVLGVIAIALFAIIVGLSATVVRASIMATLLLLARATGKTYEVMQGLMLAGSAMLILNPYLLVYDTGFQLSFLATIGLILLAPIIETRLGYVPTHAGMREFLTATLATQLFVTPFLLWQIGELSIVSIVTNVLVLPMVPVAMLLSFLAGTIAIVFPLLAVPFAFLAYLSLSYILIIPEWFAALPFAVFVVPAFPFWVVVVSYLGLAVFLVWAIGVRLRRPWTLVQEDTYFGVRGGPRLPPSLDS